jgi:hypothetical protein
MSIVGCTHTTVNNSYYLTQEGKQESIKNKHQVAQNDLSKQKIILNYEQLMRFEYDCSSRYDQLELLDDQIKLRTFYKIDGVEGNDSPERFNKKYFSLAKYRIWSLRLGCKGSSVDKATQLKLRETFPSRPPEDVPRCYFEEKTVSAAKLDESEDFSDSFTTIRKEICTNYPLVADTNEIHVGDLVDPKHQLDKNYPYLPNLRKWNGNVFQMVSKSEIHRGEVIKFTVILMWSGNGWVVVDKF